MGLKAFREAYLASDSAHEDDFESIDARRMRYALYWSQFDNSIYRRVHTWSRGFKYQYALGKYIRSLYNPANRLGNFYSAHLWGGALNLEAAAEGAIPIETENETLRPALAALWKASNFNLLKDIIALRGAVEGDVILRVQDDPAKETVFIERIAPSTVVDLTKDGLGNVKAYTLEEARQDPASKTRTVTYREEVSRDGDLVVYETFKNNTPFGWNGQPALWDVPYSFVPMVHIQHLNVGLDWGWSELHPMRSKISEIDDLASMIGDQIRKAVNPVWLMKGMEASDVAVTGASREETGRADSRPEPGREELKALWSSSKDVSADALIANLNLSDALTHVDNLLKELERDYPELQQDIWTIGSTSGRALRVARQRVEAKIHQRRESYDAGLVRLQSMGVAIGGWRGYSDYAGFNLDSYAKGDLDHTVGVRPVFTPDPMDKIEIDSAFWQAAKTAVDAGASLEGWLEREGWSEEEITAVIGEEEEPTPLPTSLARWDQPANSAEDEETSNEETPEIAKARRSR